MEKALTKASRLNIKRSSSWISKKAKKEFSNISDDINALSSTVEVKAKRIFNKISGNPVRSLLDLLIEYNLPAGLFPQNIICYDFDKTNGKLVVHLPFACEATFTDSSEVRYDTRVRGVLKRGNLTGIEGIKSKVFVWVKITAVSVEGSKSGMVIFTAGVNKSRPMDAYATPPKAVRV